jgi:cysteine desulfurase
VAKLIHADPKEIVFTSGATESNNIAVKGVARFYKDKKKHLITTQTVNFVILIIKFNLSFIILGT